MKVKKHGKLYLVESEHTKGKFYKVDLSRPSCTCPAFVFRHKTCKHVKAAQEYVEKSTSKTDSKIIEKIKSAGEIEAIKLIEEFGEEAVNSLIRRGELIEERGVIKLLE